MAECSVSIQTLLWVFVENVMAPKEVREALELEEIEKIPREFTDDKYKGKLGASSKL